MFDKKDDNLFDYAFGELDAHEAQIFEASLLKDDAAAKEVEFLRTLKDDLASFRDIPEMQYSKERLRSAILEQGLKPKKPGIRWGNWLLAPSAIAGVFALGFVLMNGTGSRPNPTFIPAPEKTAKNNDTETFSPKLSDQRMGSKIAVKDSSEKTMTIGTSPAKDEIRIAARPSIRFERSAARESIERSHEEAQEVASKVGTATAIAVDTTKALISAPAQDGRVRDSMAFGAGGGFGGPGGGAFMAKADAAPMAVFDGNNDALKVAFGRPRLSTIEAKLVVIDSDQDSGVGAPVATEVNSTANVVIGG